MQTFRGHLLRALYTPIVVMLACACVLVVVIAQLVDRAQWVDHTYEVISQANRCYSLLPQMQSAARSFQITGETNFLAPYYEARSRIDPEFGKLENLVSDNPPQVQVAKDFHQRARAFADYAGELVSKGPTAFEHSRVAEQTKLVGLRQQTEEALSRFVGEERRLLATRSTRFAVSSKWSAYGLGAGALLVGLIVGVGVRRQLVQLNASHEAVVGRLQTASADAARLAAIVSSSMNPIISKTVDGTILTWNEAATKVFGYDADEVVGKSVLMLVPKDRHKEELDSLERVKRGEAVQHYRTVRLCKNGDPIDVSVSLSPIRDGEGQVTSVSSIIRDITAEVRAEQALRRSEARLWTVLEHMEEGLVVSTAEGELMYWNPAARRMHGYDGTSDTNQLVSKFVRVFELRSLDGNLLPVEQWPLSRILRGETINGCELRVRRVDQDWEKILSYSGSLVQTATGERVGSVSIFDLTEQRKAEAALRESERKYRTLSGQLEERVGERTRELSAANERLKEVDRLKSEFLATMSHELRTPLNSIIGFTEIIAAGLAGPINDEQKKQLGMSLTSAKHLLNLINDLLDLARIESGRVQPQYAMFDATSVVDQVMETLRPIAARKHLLVEMKIEGDMRMYSDRKMVFQILLNLANNAVKFTDVGHVRLRVERIGDNLLMEVSDTGIGIKAPNLSQLFEAFRQIDGSAQRRYEGTGLGLYLCKRLATLLGGKISVRSQYGEGSVFTVVLPASADATK